jgi:hypothetical protein
VSRKTAMAELEALLTRAELHGLSDVMVWIHQGGSLTLAVADVRAILNKARFADRVNESKSNPNRRQ